MKRRVLSCVLAVTMVLILLLSACIPIISAEIPKKSNNAFNPYIFIADIWSDSGHVFEGTYPNDTDREQLDWFADNKNSFVLNCYVDNMKRSTQFMTVVATWETLTFKPSDGVEALFQDVEYYEAALLEIIRCYLNSTYEEQTVSYYSTQCAATILNEISRWVKATYDIDMLKVDKTYKDIMSPERLESLKEYLKDTTAYRAYSGLGDAVELFGDVMEMTDSFYEAVNRAAIYMELSNNAAQVVSILNDLYNNCGDNPELRAAIRNVRDVCQNKFAFVVDSVEDWTIDLFGTFADICYDALYTGIIACHPAGLMWKLGKEGVKAITNLLFSTDATVEQFYMSKCFVEVQDLIVNCYYKNRDKYINNLDVNSARQYIANVELMLAAYIKNCDYAQDMTDLVFRGGLWNKVKSLFEKDGYDKVVDNLESIQKTTRLTWELLWDNLRFYVDEDYFGYFEEPQEIIKPDGIIVSLIPTSYIPDKYAEIWMNVDQSTYIPASVTPSNCNTDYLLTYESSNPGVVSVTGNGLIHGIAPGEATIRVSLASDPEIYDDCRVVVQGLTDENYNSMSITAQGACGDNLTWTLYDDGKLRISGTGDMWDYHFSWDDHTSSIHTIIIDDKVTRVGHSAFKNFEALKKVVIGDSVKEIDVTAFEGCINLTEVYLGKSVTYIREEAFKDCSKLKTITLPDELTIIGSEVIVNDRLAFENTAIETVIIPKSVTYIHERILNLGTIKAFVADNTENSTFMDDDGVLYNKKSQALIKYPIAKNDRKEYEVLDSTLEISNDSFVGCNLNKISIAGMVTKIPNSAFQFCSNLEEVYLGRYITNIGKWAFYDCSSLTSITIPDSVTSIGEGAFSYCHSLTSITIPDSVTSIGKEAFYHCSNITTFVFDGTCVSWDAVKKSTAWDYGCNFEVTISKVDGALTHVVIVLEAVSPTCTISGLTEGSKCSVCGLILVEQTVAEALGHSWNNGVVTTQPTCAKAGVKTYTCSTCKTTKNETLSATGNHTAGAWTTTKTATCAESGMKVQKCTVCGGILKTETIATTGHSWNSGVITTPPTATLDGIKTYTCTVCSEIKTEKILATDEKGSEGLAYGLNLGGNSYTLIGIGNCTDTDVVIPSIHNGLPVTSIGKSAFSGCSSLTSITIPNNVTSIGKSAFSGCTMLTSISIPEGITRIGEYMFDECSNLTSITIPNSVTSIDYGAFNGCSSLTNITIPASVTSIGNHAFNGCFSLTSIVIPDGVTSIGLYAFIDCSGLTNVTIPYGITNIEAGTFRGCSGLTSITIPDGITSIGSYAFAECSGLTSVTIPDDVTSIGVWAFYCCSNITTFIFDGSCVTWEYVSKDNKWNEGCSFEIELLGHSWNSGVVTIQPTNTKAGIKTYNCSLCSTTREEVIPCLLDVNLNGAVDKSDANAILKHILGNNVAINEKAADVNGDGKVTVVDAVKLLLYLSGKTDALD